MYLHSHINSRRCTVQISSDVKFSDLSSGDDRFKSLWDISYPEQIRS
jgi:hypothetical protein